MKSDSMRSKSRKKREEIENKEKTRWSAEKAEVNVKKRLGLFVNSPNSRSVKIV